MKKTYDFKGHIVREKSPTHFAMFSMWDNVTNYNYVFRYETEEKVYKITFSLYLGLLSIESDLDNGENESIFDTFYYRALYKENMPDTTDVKTLCDYFKIFAGMVWAMPVQKR